MQSFLVNFNLLQIYLISVVSIGIFFNTSIYYTALTLKTSKQLLFFFLSTNLSIDFSISYVGPSPKFLYCDSDISKKFGHLVSYSIFFFIPSPKSRTYTRIGNLSEDSSTEVREPLTNFISLVFPKYFSNYFLKFASSELPLNILGTE